MIGWLRGSIIDKNQPGHLLLDVNGVGYDVETSLPTFFKLEEVSGVVDVFIHMVVREDALLLYGFIDQQERALFRALIKVNGVGPKVAIAILSSATPEAFIQCIHEKNAAMLTQLPGIGKKTAERLIVEMKDKLDGLSAQISDDVRSISHQHDAISALEALGYKRQLASKVLQDIDDGMKTSEQLIRQALQVLSTAG